MYICVTEVDAITKIICTQEPQRNGPVMPAVKGLNIEWADESAWPIEVAADGTYLRAPRYYGICDDDADATILGVLEVLSESDYYQRKQAEYIARRPYPSWLWDENIEEWVPPVPVPQDDNFYNWNESNQTWTLALNGQ